MTQVTLLILTTSCLSLFGFVELLCCGNCTWAESVVSFLDFHGWLPLVYRIEVRLNRERVVMKGELVRMSLDL